MKKILVVDDDRAVLKLTKIILEGKYEHIETSNVKEAISALEKQRFDLVFLDQRMDGRGTEVYGVIKKKFPSTKVIFVTAFFDLEPKLREVVTKDHLTLIRKPFEAKELLSAIQKELEQ